MVVRELRKRRIREAGQNAHSFRKSFCIIKEECIFMPITDRETGLRYSVCSTKIYLFILIIAVQPA